MLGRTPADEEIVTFGILVATTVKLVLRCWHSAELWFRPSFTPELLSGAAAVRAKNQYYPGPLESR